MSEEILASRSSRKAHRPVRKICTMLTERSSVLSNIGRISKIKCALFTPKLILLKSLENHLPSTGKLEKLVEDKCL